MPRGKEGSMARRDDTIECIYPNLPVLEEENADEEFAGPLEKRSCQDVVCCLLFCAFWAGMAYIAYMALQHGQPERLVLGVDSFGNVCGRTNAEIENVPLSGLDMSSKPFLFSFSPVARAVGATPSIQICVARCPNETLVTPSQYAEYELCYYNIPPEFYTVLVLASDDCPTPPVQPSFTLLNRCVPTTLADVATNFIQTDWIQTALADIKASWREILYMCLIAVALSMIILVIIRFFAGIVIWLFVILFMLGSLGGSGYLWYRWYIANTMLREIPEEDRAETDVEHVRTFLIYASVASAATVILLLILLVLAKRLRLVAALFEEAGRVLAAMPFLLLQPLWTFLATLILVGACGYVLLYLITVGEPTSQGDGTVKYVEDDFLHYMRYYFIFGILWGTQFLFAVEQCVTAGAVATWFFSRDKRHLGLPLLASYKRVFRWFMRWRRFIDFIQLNVWIDPPQRVRRFIAAVIELCHIVSYIEDVASMLYHLGSIAYGSLIIALVMTARLTLGYIQSRLRGSTTKAAEYLLKCLQCCLWLFEKVLRYLNRNAYIEIAIYGYSFCKAAQRAFTIIVSNALRVAVINSVGDFLLFLCKVAVTAGVVVIGIEFFQRNPDVNFYAVPIALAAIFAFAVSHIFLSVYEMVIDTLFLCFCEDCEKNDGMVKPYFMSRNLMTFVDNARRAKHMAEVRHAVRDRGERSNTMRLATI